MKHILCPTFVVLLVVHCVQAAEVPFVELKGYTGRVFEINFSPDGKKIFARIAGAITPFWDAETGKELFMLPGWSPSFSPDNTKIFLRSIDGNTNVWDAETGQKLYTFPERFGTASIVSPDGKKILTWRNSDSPYHIWDVEAGEELYAITSPSGRWGGWFPTFTPDGKKIRTVSYDRLTEENATHFVDAETGKELFTFPGFPWEQTPDGKKTLTKSRNYGSNVWDTESGKKFEFPGMLVALAFSPDRMKIATASEGETIIWDAESEKELFVLAGLFSGFTPDGKKIITWNNGTNPDDYTNGIVRIWNAESGEELYSLTGCYLGGTHDGKAMFGLRGNTTETRIWDIESGKELLTLPVRVQDSIYVSPDRQKVFTSGLVWDVESGKILWSFHGEINSFSSNRRVLVTTTTEYDKWDLSYEVYHLWHVESSRELTLTGEFSGFSPDGKKIVSQNDNKTHIWDVETGKELHVLTGRGGFLPDGMRIITQDNNEVRIWDVESGKELHVLPGKSCGITPDGKPITVMADNTIRIWDLSMVVE